MSLVKRSSNTGGGIQGANASTYDVFDGIGTLYRYVNGVVVQKWVVMPAEVPPGSYLGFGGITKA